MYNFNISSYFYLNKQSKNEDKKQESINKTSNSKRVTFNLDKNKIKLISPRNKKKSVNVEIKNNYINPDEIPVVNTKSIVEDNVEFGEEIYGNGIMKNSNFFNSNHEDVPNPQREFVDKLINFQNNINQNDDDIFKNQKGYWQSQTIDDYTERTYDNNQVANFNSFRENNHVGESVASVYDSLTGVQEKNGSVFGDSKLRHDDNSVMGSMPDHLYGFDHGCNNMTFE